MQTLNKIGTGLYMLLTTIIFSGCDKDDNKTEEKKPAVQLQQSATLGTYLTDKDGRALYFFSNDAQGKNQTCSGGCELLWPPFNAEGLSVDNLGQGLNIADFTTTTSPSGKTQLVYKGWPLYYYAPAVNGVNTLEAPNETKGEGVGGIWFVAKPDYTIMLVNEQLVGHDGKNYTSNYTEGTGKTLYFTDGKGITLYAFKPDKAGKNTFTKSDFSNNAIWPIYENDKVVVPSTLDKSLFSSIDVFGRKQMTYKGWPIYYFGQDANVRGANKGVSFPSPGIWPVLVKDMAAAPL